MAKMTLRGAASLLLIMAWLTQGCAKVVTERQTPAATPPAALPMGRFAVEQGKPGLVIGAPHGSSDSDTDLIGAELARRTGFGLVVATGFAFLDGDGRRYNVNRPTESVPGAAPRSEVESAAARSVYEAYRGHVGTVAQGPLRLYVEIHGNGRKESAERIEIATGGVAREEAWRLKTLLELVRDAHLRRAADGPRLTVLVEPVDRLHYTASAAKQGGILSLSERALHVELPRSARSSHRELYTAVLADFLLEASTVLLAPAPPR